MNRRGAAPGAARERRGEEKRFNRAKAGLSGAQRHTETAPSVFQEDICMTALCVTVSGRPWQPRA